MGVTHYNDDTRRKNREAVGRITSIKDNSLLRMSEEYLRDFMLCSGVQGRYLWRSEMSCLCIFDASGFEVLV